MADPIVLVRGPWSDPRWCSGLVREGLASEPHGQPSSRQIRWSRAPCAASRNPRAVAVHAGFIDAVTFRDHRRSERLGANRFRTRFRHVAGRKPRHAGRRTPSVRAGARPLIRPSSAVQRSAAARSAAGSGPAASTSRETVGTTARPVPNSRRRSAADPPCAPSPGARIGPPSPSRSTSRSRSVAPTTTPRSRSPAPNRLARSRTAGDVGQRIADHPARGVPAADGVDDDLGDRPLPHERVLQGAGVGVGGAGEHEQAAAVQARGVDGRLQRPRAE